MHIDKLCLYYNDGQSVFGSFIEKCEMHVASAAGDSELCKVMRHQGSDKGGGWHNYTILYDSLFSEKLPSQAKIFEVGLGTNNVDVPSNMGLDGVPGASLRGWKKYRPNAFVYGGDIDARILFDEPGIRTFFVDQRDGASIRDMWQEIDDKDFDLILDDGLHTFEANQTFFENSFEKLRIGGVFVIEDIVANIANIGKFDNLLQGFHACLYRVPDGGKNIIDNVVALICR